MPASFTSADFLMSLRHPKAAFKFACGNRTNAYATLMHGIVSRLSRTPKHEIADCLAKSIADKTLFLPKSLSYVLHRKEYIGINSILCYYVTRMLQPKKIVETGVLSGRSTLMILQALHDNDNGGKLYSIDLGKTEFSYKLLDDSRIDNVRFISYAKQSDRPTRSSQDAESDTIKLPYGKEIGWLIPNNLRNDWKLILGDSRVELPKLLNDLGIIDIFIHDSDHSYDAMMYEFKTSWPFIKNKGLLCSDDTFFNNSWKDFSDEIKSQQVVVDDTFGIMVKNGSMSEILAT